MRRETKVIGQGTSDEVTEITRYEYDYNGNMTYKGKETIKPEDIDSQETFDAYLAGSKKDSQLAFYEYNGLNQLFRAMEEGKLIEYAYNAEGLRTNKTVNGVMTVHVWDGNNMVAELDEKGSLIAKYIRGINLIAADNYNGSSTTRQYYVYNGHGDVVLLTNSSGSVTKTYEYDAFGVEKNPDPNDINPFRYCGEYFDTETGNIYLRARYYDPSVGRFISEDPIRDGFNWYSYCFNNPINFIDPNGLKYVPLRATIEGLGGSVSWDSKTGVVTISLDGGTAYAFNGDGNGNFIQGDLMYSDDVWLFAALSVTFDLGNGWTGRIERDASGGRYDKHVHVYKGNKAYAQNEDGSPHDGSTGSPPKKQKENLKNKKGWDWDAKENDWVNKIEIRSGIDGDGWIISYPNGRTVTILNPWIMGVPMQAPYPDREALRQYYTGPTLINPRGSGTDGTVPVLPMPNPVPVPVPAPMPVPAFGF